jgi:hypothetical protein
MLGIIRTVPKSLRSVDAICVRVPIPFGLKKMKRGLGFGKGEEGKIITSVRTRQKDTLY